MTPLIITCTDSSVDLNPKKEVQKVPSSLQEKEKIAKKQNLKNAKAPETEKLVFVSNFLP